MRLWGQEYRRVLWGALVLDGVYLLIALLFSFLSFKTVGGLLLGTAYAVLNSVILEWTVGELVKKSEAAGKRFYLLSYLGRFALAGLILAAGFQWLDPFAAMAPMLAPKAAYTFLAFTRKEVK